VTDLARLSSVVVGAAVERGSVCPVGDAD